MFGNLHLVGLWRKQCVAAFDATVFVGVPKKKSSEEREQAKYNKTVMIINRSSNNKMEYNN